MLVAFKMLEDRRRAKDECEKVVRSSAGGNEKAALSIGEMEAEHLRVCVKRVARSMPFETLTD